MTRPDDHPGGPNERRTQVALAMITGVLAGAARAVASWLLDRLASGC